MKYISGTHANTNINYMQNKIQTQIRNKYNGRRNEGEHWTITDMASRPVSLSRLSAACLWLILNKHMKWIKNGITDACSTVDCCPLLSVVVHCCPLLSIVVNCCSLLRMLWLNYSCVSPPMSSTYHPSRANLTVRIFLRYEIEKDWERSISPPMYPPYRPP